MNIVLLGSGNVATHLGQALKRAGHTILQVWSRKLENAELLSSLLGSSPVAEPAAITDAADLYILSVSDDAIENVAASLRFHDKIIIHTAGSVDMNVLAQFSSRFGVLYPVQTFSRGREADFSRVPLAIEGSSTDVRELLRQLAAQLSSKIYILNSEQRCALHIAAVFASNFTNHLYALAGSLLAEQELDFEMLRPLISETAAKVQNSSPREMQTGPAVRHDTKTLARHLDLLKGRPELSKLYELLSQSIVNFQHKSA